MNQTEDIGVELDSEITVMLEIAQAMVEKNERVVPGVDVIKLAFQGKILDDTLKVGNYTQEDAIFQIFKLSRSAQK